MHKKFLPACSAIALLFSQFGAATALEKSTYAGKGKPREKSSQTRNTECLSARIEIGPFDLKRRYRSMEGPYVMLHLRIADLLASRKVQVPESAIVYIEGAAASPSMQSQSGSATSIAVSHADCGTKERELYWFRGVKIEVLDEKGRIMPNAEFICHTNIDVDQVTRFSTFPELERSGSKRIVTLTQGQTSFQLPAGYAVPVADDEEWTFTFQAANRTSDRERRVKHLCTIYFDRDADLKNPPKALNWYNPFMAVKASSEAERQIAHGPGCAAITAGENAPNMVPNTNFKNGSGQELIPHWSVPPGRHSYVFPLSSETDCSLSSEDRSVHAVWTHIHPGCTSTTLSSCAGDKKQKVFTVQSSTKFTSGPELRHIDRIISSKGLKLKAGQNYVLAATYENPLSTPLDSMVALGVFCESKTFKRPDWAEEAFSKQGLISPSESRAGSGNCELYCGIKGSASPKSSANAVAGASGN